MPEYHAAVVAFVDEAMQRTSIQQAQARAQQLTDACPLTPITTADEATARRKTWDDLKTAILDTEDTVKPYRSRLHQIGAYFRERIDLVLAAPKLRADAVARLLGNWDAAEETRAKAERDQAIRDAVEANRNAAHGTAAKAIVEAAVESTPPPKTGPGRKTWTLTIADEAAVLQRILELPADHAHASLLRSALKLHVPTLRKILANVAGADIATAAELPGVTVKQERKAVARRRGSAPPTTCTLCGAKHGQCEHTGGAPGWPETSPAERGRYLPPEETP